MSDLGEGDGEIETIMKSTKIGEERIDEVAESWKEMKGKVVGITRGIGVVVIGEVDIREDNF